MTRERISSFAEFWPHYLRAHADRRTRSVHYIGTTIGVLLFGVFLVTGSWPFLVAAPVAGYAPAMLSHPVFEGNRPLTFTHPLWSFCADFYMLYVAVLGRTQRELERSSL
jgi:hypothetical protein